MPAPKKSVAGYIAKKIIKKVKPELKKTLKTPKPNVKVVPSAKTKANYVAPSKKTISKVPPKKATPSMLDTRGAKPTKTESINRAREYQWNKLESRMDQMYDTRAGGPRAGEINTAGPGKANARKAAAVSRAANKKFPIKINTNPIKKKSN